MGEGGKKKFESERRIRGAKKTKAETIWEQCGGQLSAAPLSLTLDFCSKNMMLQDAHQ